MEDPNNDNSPNEVVYNIEGQALPPANNKPGLFEITDNFKYVTIPKIFITLFLIFTSFLLLMLFLNMNNGGLGFIIVIFLFLLLYISICLPVCLLTGSALGNYFGKKLLSKYSKTYVEIQNVGPKTNYFIFVPLVIIFTIVFIVAFGWISKPLYLLGLNSMFFNIASFTLLMLIPATSFALAYYLSKYLMKKWGEKFSV